MTTPLNNDESHENTAQTLARELKAPVILKDEDGVMELAIPPEWEHESVDRSALLVAPLRIKATATLTIKAAFIDYVNRNKDRGSTVWCNMEPNAGAVVFHAIFDDHVPGSASVPPAPAWREHRAKFAPSLSVEWKRWADVDRKPMSQEVFAGFLEDNMADINGGDGYPEGGSMLKMALDFQAKQDSVFKSAVRLQSGGVRMEFICDQDKGTVEAMQVFERFRIAIPVFRDDAARFPLTARLRYKVSGGKLAFWYELIRPDVIFEQSSMAMIEYVMTKCGLPFFFGSAG